MASKQVFIAGVRSRDPAYSNIRDSIHPDDILAKEFCQELWETYEKYADDHFIEEIQNDFDARFWEMYLTCTLLERGNPVSCPKPGPDVLLNHQGLKIWIEAIAPSSGHEDSPDSVPEMKACVIQPVPNDQVILRYAAAISEKSNKRSVYVKNKIVGESDPYLIAINGCKVRNSRTDFDPPRIVRSVFPLGDEYVTVEIATGTTVDTGFHFRRSITKTSGAEVPIDIFLDERYSSISGVLFSNSDCVNRPRVKGEDFVLVHNPLAKNPVPHGLLKIGREYFAVPNMEEYTLKFNDWRAQR